MADWFTQNAPDRGWFASNAPQPTTPARPAGLPAGVELPGFPASPQPQMQTSAVGEGYRRLVGNNPISDAGSVVGNHLKNMVAGPYHAFSDAPSGPLEKIAYLLGGGGGGVAAARMFIKPTVDALGNAYSSARQGKYTEAANHAMDAVPIAGPWARSIENDAQEHGALSALLGLGTDIAGPEALSGALKGAGVVGGSALRVATANKESLALAASRKLMDGSTGDLLQSALKPGVKYGAGAGAILEKSLPDALAADPNMRGVSGMSNALDTARDEAAQPYNNVVAPYRQLPKGASGPVRQGTISGTPIADAQMKSIPTMDKVERPGATGGYTRAQAAMTGNGAAFNASPSGTGGIINHTANIADNYRNNFDIPTLDGIRGDANGKLNAFYNKAGGDRAAALSNPETARVKAVGDATREILYPRLESDAGLTPGSIASMQDKYARLVDASDIAGKREPVFSRHDPINLAQHVAAGHGGPMDAIFNFMKQKALRNLVDSDAQVNSAIDRYQNPDGTPLVSRDGIAPRTIMSFGTRLRDAPRLPLYANPAFLGGRNAN